MTTVAHDPSGGVTEKHRWIRHSLVPEMWASLAIAVIWLAVLFDALFGPNIESSNVTSTTSIPSAVVVAVFAYLATRVVAKHGFDSARHGGD